MGARASLSVLSFTGAVVTCALMCAAGGAAAQTSSPAATPAPMKAAPVETVVIAAEDDWAPYSYAKPGSTNPEGMAPVLVTAAFETQGIRVKFVVVPFARCLAMAKSGAAVGCFDTAMTDENRNQYHWHPTPLFQEELAVFARLDSTQKDLTVQQLEGHTLGVTVGYTYPSSITANPRIRQVPVTSDANLLNMLVAGRVDYILLNSLPGYYRASLDPKLAGRFKRVGVVEQQSFWVCFSRKHPDGKRLSEVFETGVEAIKANGTYARITTDFHRRLNLPAR